MGSTRLKTGWAAWLLYAFAAVLLVSATVQAAHFCGLTSPQTSASAQDDGGSSPTSPVCTVCLLAHSVAALLIAMVAFSLLLHRAPHRFVPQSCFIPVLTSFELYVRPPPAWL